MKLLLIFRVLLIIVYKPADDFTWIQHRNFHVLFRGGSSVEISHVYKNFVLCKNDFNSFALYYFFVRCMFTVKKSHIPSMPCSSANDDVAKVQYLKKIFNFVDRTCWSYKYLPKRSFSLHCYYMHVILFNYNQLLSSFPHCAFKWSCRKFHCEAIEQDWRPLMQYLEASFFREGEMFYDITRIKRFKNISLNFLHSSCNVTIPTIELEMFLMEKIYRWPAYTKDI